MRILASIITYHPDLQRLLDNLHSVRDQVDDVVIFDNGSTDLREICPGVIILNQEGTNIGVASALNHLCQYARDNNFDWILTLDQDSIVPPGLINGYLPYMTEESIALISPAIRDRNYGSMSYDMGTRDSVDDIDVCITSGSCLRLSALAKIGGFWDDLFIDMVDFDLCWSLKEAGFRILRVNNLLLSHEIGHSKIVRLFGKENIVYNHPASRCYYMIRNTIAVGKKHNRIIQCARWVLKRVILINLFEDDRLHKDKMIIKGIIDGIRFPI